MWRGILALIVLAAVGTLPAQAADQPYFRALGYLPGGIYNSQAYAVNADGSVVVGASDSTSGVQAFRWTAATGMVGLGDLPGGQFSGDAFGVSGDGSVIVGSSSSSTGKQAFRWTQKTGMQPMYAADSGAYGVSGDGKVIVGTIGRNYPYAFQWTASNGTRGLATLSGYSDDVAVAVSADGSVIVGGVSSGFLRQAVRWTNGVPLGLGDLAGGDFDSSAKAVSADGNVVVGWSMSANGLEAFRWTASTGMVGLGDLPGGDFWSQATSITADGSIITGISSGTRDGPFIWDALHGMRPLQDLLVNQYHLDLTGWSLENAYISADGSTIVGLAHDSRFYAHAYLVHLPEPTTAASLALAWLFLARPLRRRRRPPS